LVWPMQMRIHYCTLVTTVWDHCISKPFVHILLTLDFKAKD